MKKTFLHSLTPRKALAGLALTASLAVTPGSHAQFLPTGAGPYDYDDTANWNGGTINNNFGANPTADQTVYFDGNLTLSSSWTINNTTLFNRSFVGSGGDRTVTLGGNISLGSSATNANKVTIGSTVAGEAVNLDLGGASRNFFVGTNRTLEVVNTLSGAGGIAQQGVGTLTLSGTANTYTGATSFGGSGISSGVLEITKLANGGQASSIGASSNAADRLVFGGNTTGTLRYIGSGDSTDRRFSVGGVGAIFDASGSGAVNFTNTAAVAYSGASNTTRSLTLTGTNTGNNTMTALVGNNGTGVTTITKDGTGTWVLAGANTYTGNTNVNAGTLVLGTTGSINNSVGVNIAAGAAFDTTAKNFVMLSGQEFTFTLDPTAAGSAGMLVAGALDISAGVVDFTLTGPLDDDVYVIASYTSLTGGSFASVTAPSGYTIDYAYNGGTQIALVVPEPSAVALLVGSLCTVMIFRRNRR